MGTKLILIDTENSEAFTIVTAGTVTKITDTDFPPNQTPAVPLAYGGAVLDQYLFVMGTNGIIYNSNVGDPTAWTALDYIEAERSPDGGQYLARHGDNLVAFGVHTIEFFYNNSNTTGSPLNRRQDIAYNIGCSDGESVWEDGDRIFFIGVDSSGALDVNVLENFQIRQISPSSLSSFLTQAIVKDNYSVMGSGFSAQGHSYYILTLYTTPSDISPDLSLAYDTSTGIWGIWDTAVNGLSKFPLVHWSVRTGTSPRYGEGILSNGDLITINDNMNPQDTLLASTYVTTGYVLTGYVQTAGSSGTAITMKIRTGHYDGGVEVAKSLSDIRPVCNQTTSTQNLTIRWADENNSSFTTGEVIDMSKFNKVRRCGRFRRRNHEIEYSGTEALRLEALECNIKIGER